MMLSTWYTRIAHKHQDISTKLVTCASTHVSTRAWQMQVANFVLMPDHGGKILSCSMHVSTHA